MNTRENELQQAYDRLFSQREEEEKSPYDPTRAENRISVYKKASKEASSDSDSFKLYLKDIELVYEDLLAKAAEGKIDHKAINYFFTVVTNDQSYHSDLALSDKEQGINLQNYQALTKLRNKLEEKTDAYDYNTLCRISSTCLS